MEGDQPKKKRVRKKPGRYKLQNRRVAQREAMARQRENQEGSEDGSKENKAVYTASSVACFWAGAVTRPYTLQQALAESLLIASSAEKALSN